MQLLGSRPDAAAPGQGVQHGEGVRVLVEGGQDSADERVRVEERGNNTQMGTGTALSMILAVVALAIGFFVVKVTGRKATV